MDKKSDNEILNILKIDEKILKNICGLSFRDKKLEEDYLNYNIKLNIILKSFIYLLYLFDLASLLIKGISTNVLWISIVQIIFTSTFLIVIIGIYVVKNPVLKKFCETIAILTHYLFIVIYISSYLYNDKILDENYRLKWLFFLSSISTFDILLSIDSGLIIPIFMFVINALLILLIYPFSKNLSEYFIIIRGIFFLIVTVTIFKRKIDEGNRRSFIQQHIFKKYYLYHYDLLNNINGFHFSLRSDLLIKINDNLKFFLNNIKHSYFDQNTKVETFKQLLGIKLEENKIIKEEEKKDNNNSDKILGNIEGKILSSNEDNNLSNARLLLTLKKK